jgi:hypothetical protein
VLAAARAAFVAGAVAAVLYLMLDSGLVGAQRAPALTSLSLGGLGLLFGLGAWATWVVGQRERSPLLAGLAIGVGGYALVRLVAF